MTRMPVNCSNVTVIWTSYLDMNVNWMTNILELTLEVSECMDQTMIDVHDDRKGNLVIFVYDNGYFPYDIVDQFKTDFDECHDLDNPIEYLEGLGYNVEFVD